jgi:hypothetical protein
MLNNPGWNKLENELNPILKKVNLKMINTFINEHGLLKLEFEQTEDEVISALGKILTFYYERMAAKTCQECGAWASRRKDLPTLPTLCFQCYIPVYNKFHESQGENNVLPSG